MATQKLDMMLDMAEAPDGKRQKATDDAHVTVQLRKLREGAGLTAGRLAKFGSVLSCLGTSDASEGVVRLTSALAELGDTEEARALKVDYGLELSVLLERAPTPREIRWLGDRRSGYAEVIKRDVKTLARWSDKAIADLRPLLIDDTFRGNLYVAAAVDGDRIAGITIIQEELEEQPNGVKRRTSTDLENPSEDPSIPALVYAMPRDWRPASLHMAVVFRQERPTRVWASVSDTLVTAPFAARRWELTVDETGTASCKFQTPPKDNTYAVVWLQM